MVEPLAIVESDRHVAVVHYGVLATWIDFGRAYSADVLGKPASVRQIAAAIGQVVRRNAAGDAT